MNPPTADLTEYLADLSRQHDDAIPFETYMREALYHPRFGYYSANIQTVGGRHADFSTSATLLPGLSRAIASWIQSELRQHNTVAADTSIIEIGAGDGSLLLNILKSLRPRFRRALHFHIVETSPILETLQREKLAKFPHIQWHREMEQALNHINRAEGASGLNVTFIYSNELVDAFPVTALRYNADPNHWEEICLSFHPDSGLKENFRHFDPDPAFSLFQDQHSFTDGQRAELHCSCRDWLHSWLPALEKGSLLTIDYGDTVENLYGGHTKQQSAEAENRVQRHAGGDIAENLYQRSAGNTLRAFYKHQRLDGADIYRNFGKQDLTADVNFTDLKNWGESLGLETVSLQSQAEFIGNPSGASHPAHAAFQILHQRTPTPSDPEPGPANIV